MKVILDIPSRHCDCCNGEINIQMHVLETMKGYTVTEVTTDVFDSNEEINYFVLEE